VTGGIFLSIHKDEVDVGFEAEGSFGGRKMMGGGNLDSWSWRDGVSRSPWGEQKHVRPYFPRFCGHEMNR